MKAGRSWRKSSRTGALIAAVTMVGWLGSAPAAVSADAAPTQAKDASRAKEKDDARASASPAGARLPIIDKLISEGWQAAEVKPSKLCTDEEFLRRAYLDVLGRIPNIEEAAAFLQSKEKGKRAKLVDYLLKHEDFARNFSNILTVVLVGRKTNQRQLDREALAGWLRQQFNAERPWNEIAYELITAKGSNKENGAVNYTLAHLDGGAVPLTSLTTRVFLGQQIQCTQCHDHPSNDWKQADFWGINAFFKGIRRRDVRKEDATGAAVIDHIELYDEPTAEFASYDKRNGLMAIAFPKFLDGRKISQSSDVDRRLELGKLIADPKNENFAKAFVNRLWAHFLGRGFVNPVDDFGAHNTPSHPELLDAMAKAFMDDGYNIKDLMRWIMNSQAYHLSSAMTKANEKDETLFSHMNLKPMTPEQLFDSLLTATAAHKTGGARNSEQQRNAWLSQFIFAFANDEGDEGTTFNGTIPQALMMMNGELMERAVGCKSGSFLDDMRLRALRQSKTAPHIYMVNNLFLAALSRHPTRAEMTAARKILASQPDTLYVLEDLFWALLNSNEFILNH